MKRSYENAIRILETRRRKARPKHGPSKPAIGKIPGSNGESRLRGTPSLVGMSNWLRDLGHSESDIDKLNVIHIAGTKGKGSTCAFVRSLLHAHGLRTGFPYKIGLYTSPDLRCVRERIQLNDKPITVDIFAKYFFEVWDGVSSRDPEIREDSKTPPRYLQLLALLALHTFIREQTEVVILETHHGGEYDATNVVQKPAVTGITPIGMDHVAQLGPTLESIAWHKAGIFKHGAPAFSAPQDPQTEAVLQTRAAEKTVDLTFVPVDTTLLTNSQSLNAPVQRMNCSLAITISNAFLKHRAPEGHHQLSQSDIISGIENFSWPGRFETIREGKCSWFLDGAHNELSVKQAAMWFAQATPRRSLPILIFSHFSEERDGVQLLECLAKSLSENGVKPHTVIFTTYTERLDGKSRIDKTFKIPETPFPDFPTIYHDLWKQKIDPEAQVFTEPTIEGALNLARKIGEQQQYEDEGLGMMQTLITGSLHLVGGALNILRPYD